MEGGGGSAARRHGGDAGERGRGLDRGVAERCWKVSELDVPRSKANSI